MKRIIALLLALVMVFAITGCDKKEEVATSVDDGVPHPNEMALEYASIDEMPDWTGPQLDLKVWYTQGNNDVYIGKVATDDKFRDEIKRVFGITFNEKESFDNAGQSGETKIAQMVATKDFPDIAVSLGASNPLGEAGKLWDIAPFIEECMPNYMKIVNSADEIKRQFETQGNEKGERLSFQRLRETVVRYNDPEYSFENYKEIIDSPMAKSYIYVRDDILKQIYPEALTVKDYQDIYVEKGEYTREQITDVTIKSRDEFKELLQKINELGVTEMGRKVWPTYIFDGGDNWNLLTQLSPVLAGSGFADSQVNDVNYFDIEQKKIVSTVEQDWFKDNMKFFTSLVQEGLASTESLIDDAAAFKQKVNNGEYAVLYGATTVPTAEQLAATDKPYAYRRVMLDIPYNNKKFAHIDTNYEAFTNYPISFFKDSMTEAEVKQFLRFLDFFYTETGTIFAHWGSEKSGLHKRDENGDLVFTDEAFEKAMVYGKEDQALIDYGVCSFPRIDLFMNADNPGYSVNNLKPAQVYSKYEKERIPAEYQKAWDWNLFEEPIEFPALNFKWTYWNYTSSIEGIKTLNNARQEWEDALTNVYISKNDEEFEKAYSDAVQLMRDRGLNEQSVEEMNTLLKEKNIAGYYNDFLAWVDAQ